MYELYHCYLSNKIYMMAKANAICIYTFSELFKDTIIIAIAQSHLTPKPLT